MKKPIRVQRKRIKGWRMPANTVYVGRPTGYGNPYHADYWMSNERAVKLFREKWVNHFNVDTIRQELSGKNLACWCPLDKPCHADVLLEIANSPNN